MSTKTKLKPTKKKITKEIKEDIEDESEVNINSSSDIILSDDYLDQLEGEIDKHNDTQKLSDKINLNKKLQEKIDFIFKEINSLVDKMNDIDKITIDKLANDKINTNNNVTINNDNISDFILDAENLVQQIDDEESLLLKIKHYEEIIRKIIVCKDFYDKSGMKVTHIN